MSDSVLTDAPTQTVSVDASAVCEAITNLEAIGDVISRLASGAADWEKVSESLWGAGHFLRMSAFGDPAVGAADEDMAIATDPTRVKLEVMRSETAAELYEALGLHDEAALNRRWAEMVSDASRTDQHLGAPWHGTTPQAELVLDRDPQHTAEEHAWESMGRSIDRLEELAGRLEARTAAA